MTNDRDLELGPMDSSAAPGNYVTQMRAAQNPVRFAQGGGGGGGGGGGVEGVQNVKNTASPPATQGRPPQSNRGFSPHYGIESEPECCLCSKVGRILLVTFVMGFAALVVLYIYWPDILKIIEPPETHAEALKSQCGVDLLGTELQPAPSLLQGGAMDWSAICDQNKKSITVMKKIPKTWRKQEINAKSWENGFGDLSSSFWLGMKLLQHITNNGKWNLRVDLKQSGEKDIRVIYHGFTAKNWTLSLYTVKYEPESKEGFHVPRLAAEAGLDTKEIPCHLDMAHQREKRWGFSGGADDDDAETNVGSTVAPKPIATENAGTDAAEDEKADKEDASTVADEADDAVADGAVDDGTVADDGAVADGAVADDGAVAVADVDVTTEASPADDTIAADDKATDASAADASATDASANDAPANDASAADASATDIVIKETAEDAKGSEDAAPTSEVEKKEDVEEINSSEIAETTATTSVERKEPAVIPTAAVAEAAPEDVGGSSGSDGGDSASPKKPELNAVAPNVAAAEGDSPEMKSCLFQKIFEMPCACVFTCGGQKICPAELTLTLFRV